MGSQLVTLAALEHEYELDREAFRDKAISVLFPSAVHGTALAARGERPFKAPQRWACIAGLKVAGMLAMKTEVSVAFLIAEQIGTKDPAEAKRLIEAAGRARQSGPEDAYRLAKQIVRDRIKADPDERRRAMQELFGLIDAEGLGGSLAGSAVETTPNTSGTSFGDARASQVPSRANGTGHQNGDSHP